MDLPIPIPYALDYTATLTAQVAKFVRCEKCATEYVYFMKRTAQGEGSSLLFLDNAGAKKRARAEAESSLQRKLDQGCDSVPCPECGWYQDQMIQRARRLRYRWMTTALFFVVPIAILFLLIALFHTVGRIKKTMDVSMTEVITFWVVALGFVAASVGIPICKRRLSRGYDLNLLEDVEVRKKIAQELAIRKEEFLKLIEQRGSEPAT